MKILKKIFIPCAAFIIVGVIVINYMIVDAAENVEESSGIEAFVKIQCEAANISATVGEESILPQVYASVKSHKLFESGKRAGDNAREDLLSSEATYRYAVRNGFGITEEELYKNLNLLVSEMKEAEEYAVIEGYYNENGTSLEENIFDNYKLYETEYVINNMYIFYKNSYFEGNTAFNGYEYDSWMSYWEAIEKEAYIEYGKTEDCNIMEDAIDTAIDITGSRDIETLIDNDISNGDLPEAVEDTSVYDKLSYEHNEIIGE